MQMPVGLSSAGVSCAGVCRAGVRCAMGAALWVGCGGAEAPTSISLVERFGSAIVENAVVPTEAGEPVQWRFDGESTVAVDEPELQATSGWRAMHGIEGLAVRDGRLVGRTGQVPILIAAAPAGLDPSDTLHALEIDRDRGFAVEAPPDRLTGLGWNHGVLDDG